MSKNKVIKKRKDPIADPSGGKWVSGPIDWPDVAVIQCALETWSKGAKLDFEVTEDLFYKMLSCKGAEDDEYFDFSDGRIRWRDQSARNHVERQQRTTVNAAANLDFPTTLSTAAHWYCFAQRYTECSLPGYVAKVLEAQGYEEAEAILQEANRLADDLVGKSAKKLLSTPQKPASGYFIAQQVRNEARQSQLAVASCLSALRAARTNAIKAAYLLALHGKGLAETQIDYPMLLRLTTFGASHLGSNEAYALRMDGNRVVGIEPGQGRPAFHPLYSDGDLLALADHQADASLLLPTTATGLVGWVLDQGGDIQFAIPGAEDLAPEPEKWVGALNALVPTIGMRVAPSTSYEAAEISVRSNNWKKIHVRKGARTIRVLVVEALNELCVLPRDANAVSVIVWLVEHRKGNVRSKAKHSPSPPAFNASPVASPADSQAEQQPQTVVEYRDGLDWWPLTVGAVGKVLRALAK